MRYKYLFLAVVVGALNILAPACFGQVKPAQPALANFDKRKVEAKTTLPEDKAAAVARLRARIPSAKVEFDAILGSPKMISASAGFLSGPSGQGKAISPETADAFPAD